MNKQRFSPTRFVFVIVLLGALYMVSKVVTPAPPGPPAPPPPPPSKGAIATLPNDPHRVDPKAMVQQQNTKMAQMAQQAKQAEERRAIIRKINGGKDLPDDDGVTNKHFTDYTMGKQGLQQVDLSDARIKQINAEADRIMKEKDPKFVSKTAYVNKPIAEPGTPAPISANSPKQATPPAATSNPKP